MPNLDRVDPGQVVPQEYGYTLIKTPAALTNFMARQTGRGAVDPFFRPIGLWQKTEDMD